MPLPEYFSPYYFPDSFWPTSGPGADSTILPRPTSGYLRLARLELPDAAGFIYLMVNSSGFNDTINPQYTNYVLNPFTGPKQKTLHSKGTKEISTKLTGTLSQNSYEILSMLDPSFRGKIFPSLLIQQGYEAYYMENLYWSSIQVDGAQNQNVQVSIDLRTTVLPVQAVPISISVSHSPVPAWSTGASYVSQWSISHTVALTPVWRNDESMLPSYYRSGKQDYQFNISTALGFIDQDSIQIAINRYSLIEGIVTSRAFTTGAGHARSQYQQTLTNVRFTKTQTGDVLAFPRPVQTNVENITFPLTQDTDRPVIDPFSQGIEIDYDTLSWPDSVPGI